MRASSVSQSLLVIAVLLMQAVLPTSASGQVIDPASGHAYLLTATGLDYLQARAAATAAGGYLVAINSAAEDAFLTANFTGQRLWIGLTDEVTEGTFLWDSGEPLTYTNWFAGEPNNYGGAEHYVEWGLGATNQWNDQTLTGNGYVVAGIIEIPGGTPTWQTNQPASSFDIDGVLAGPFGPAAVTTRCVGTVGTITFASTLVGNPYDVLVSAQPLVSATQGGIVTPGGQVANIDILGATAPPLWLFGGVIPDFVGTAFPAPSFPVPYTMPPLTGSLSAQMVVLDPGSPDGIALSQGAELQSINASTTYPLAGPTSDDGSVAVPGCFTFYGTSYSQVFVNSNGRITMNAGSTIWGATVALAASGDPMCGLWTDLSPNIGGTITVNNPSPQIVSFDYVGVPYFGEAATASTFSIVYDAGVLGWAIDGLLGVVPNPLSAISSGDAAFLGISMGMGATDPGGITFTFGGSGGPALPTDMIYDYNPAGTPASIGNNLNRIDFFPSGGGYIWVGT